MKERQIVNAQEMRQLDKLTISENNVTSYNLMEETGERIFNYLNLVGMINETETVLIVAGTGNNGGDALIVGRHLLEKGLRPQFLIVGKPDNQSNDSLEAMASLNIYNVEYIRVEDFGSVNDSLEAIEASSIIIDGLFGIGLSRDVEGYHQEVIELINNSYAKVISIDLPSGINADNGLKMNVAVKANHTIVVQNYKQGNLLNDALDYSGEIFLLDVGILQTLFHETQVVLNKSFLKNKIPTRKRNSYKYNFGNLLVIGGSKGLMGAPLISGYTALRTGSGLSSVTYNDIYLHHINNVYPEIMVNTYFGIEDLPSQIQNKSVVIFGPGLGKSDEVNLDISSYLFSLDVPLLIDADGIFYLKKHIKQYNERKNIIITPHYKEMASFLGVDIEDVKKEPVLYAKNIAHKYNVTVVLKGTCTIITNNNETYFSILGNPGLATAGTGDVLSGIIGSLLGRGFTPIAASKIGVLIHSIAAEYARDKYGEEGMIATDLIEFIPQILKNHVL